VKHPSAVPDRTQSHHLEGGATRQQELRSASRRSLVVALALTFGYMLAEVAAGYLSHSLALLADAGHMLADTGALGLALVAMWVAGRPASITRTFGFQRTEVLAALLNALGLWLIVGWLLFEAYQRLVNPAHVQGGLMLAVGAGGLLINLVVAGVLRRSAQGSLNVQGAFFHVLGDLLGSVAVVVGGLLITAFGWYLVDPIFGVVIGLLVLISSVRLLRRVTHVLMEGTPSNLDLHRLCQSMEQVKGVTGVHDIHAWSITPGYDAFSAHVTVDRTSGQDPSRMLGQLRDIAAREFGISHVTIQLEESPELCPEDHHIAHPDEPGQSLAGGPAVG
jgi:cobalt-zinc-cadmium efflux system protein